jgi:hypothetical protein
MKKSRFKSWLLFVLSKNRLKTYQHADAKQRKTFLWPNMSTNLLHLPNDLGNVY